MINQSQSLLSLSQPCHEAVQWTIGRLNQGDLQVLQTFDFDAARGDEVSCTCAYHCSDCCDCQMVVLLVYGKDSQPVSLMVHGHAGKSWVSLVQRFQAGNPALEAQVRKLLAFSGSRSETEG